MFCCGYHGDHGRVAVWTVPTAGGVGYLHPASGYNYVKKTGLGSERTVTERRGAGLKPGKGSCAQGAGFSISQNSSSKQSS